MTHKTIGKLQDTDSPKPRLTQEARNTFAIAVAPLVFMATTVPSWIVVGVVCLTIATAFALVMNRKLKASWNDRGVTFSTTPERESSQPTTSQNSSETVDSTTTPPEGFWQLGNDSSITLMPLSGFSHSLKRLASLTVVLPLLALSGFSCVGSNDEASVGIGSSSSALTATDGATDLAGADTGIGTSSGGARLPVDIMGPETITSVSRRHQEQVLTFDIPAGVAGPFTLIVENGEQGRAEQPHHARKRRHHARKRRHSRGRSWRTSRIAVAKVWLNGDRVLGPRDINKARESARVTDLALGDHNELSVRFLGPPGSFLRLRVVAEGCDASTEECGEIRICHFDKHDSPHIIKVERDAFTTHLEHGDGLAPASVQTDADCLVPQPPPEPVSVTAMTGDDGIARFLVPETNIRVVATVLDDSDTQVTGATVALFAAGSDYLIFAYDATGLSTQASAPGVGSLLDARPGSAPTLVESLVYLLRDERLCEEREPNGVSSASNGCSAPLYHYYPIMVPFLGPVVMNDACDLHDECYSTCNRPKGDCDSEFLANMTLGTDGCRSSANPVACEVLALHFYSAVSLLGPAHYADAQNKVCKCCESDEIVCRDTCVNPNCTGGKAFDSVRCECACPPDTIECASGLCVPDTCDGGAFLDPATCMCDCPPGMVDCQGVCTSYQCSGGGVLSPESCQCECPSGTSDCNGQCVPDCTGGQVLSTSCVCECPPDTVECGGQCVSMTCQPDYAWEPMLCRCVPCLPGDVVCGGQCVTDCTTNGQVLNPATCICECPPDTVECGGQCVSNACGPGEVFDADPAVCGCHEDCTGGRVWNGAECACPGDAPWSRISLVCDPTIVASGEVLAWLSSSGYSVSIFTAPATASAEITAKGTYTSDWYDAGVRLTQSAPYLVEVPFEGGNGCDHVWKHPTNNMALEEMNNLNQNVTTMGAITVGPGTSVAIAGSDCYFGDNFQASELVIWEARLQ